MDTIEAQVWTDTGKRDGKGRRIVKDEERERLLALYDGSGCLRLVFDSDLNNKKQMPCRYGFDDKPMAVPATMIRDFTVDGKTADGDWIKLHRIERNVRRLWMLPVARELIAIRWTGHST